MGETIKFLSPVLNTNGEVIDQLTCTAEQVTLNAASVDFDLIKIPSGRFRMGSLEDETDSRHNERPLHDVFVDEFFLGRIPVTQRQWRAVVGAEPRCAEQDWAGELPVVNVWLDEALTFCTRLSELTGFGIRLPSEAEWEYGCRAGTDTAFNLGPTLSISYASFASPTRVSNLVQPGSFNAPNRFGLHDMHGNVWEWCADIWHENYNGAPTDGSAWGTGGDAGYCVQRGGSWRSPLSSARSAARVGDIARNDEDVVGLRVCFSM